LKTIEKGVVKLYSRTIQPRRLRACGFFEQFERAGEPSLRLCIKGMVDLVE
jgi:hypothetical protein